MKLFVLKLFVLLSVIAACDKEDQNVICKNEGEIIDFDSLKCGTCWGWIIKVGNDTIKSREIDSDIFGFQFDQPLKVNIKVGDALKEGTNDFPYFEIECIEERP